MQTSVELFTTNNLWMMMAAALVFIMHLGFATLETGLTRSRNSVNVLFKNTFVVCVGILTYAVVGFGLMYPGEFNGWLGFAGLGIGTDEAGLTSAYNAGYTYWTDFLFQAMFAATCATIVSGAVAERIRLDAFIIFATVFVAFVYPILGSWKWGLGWLDRLGFYDFAGSTIVHGVGGWAALAGVLVLGPRHGKYAGNRVHPIPGSNMSLAVIGVFLLWLGWFGFNGGSVLSAAPGPVSLVLVTTTLAGAAGGVCATFVSWARFKKPDLSMALNGILAGLVGITAGADQMTPLWAIVIGTVAGAVVVFSVTFLERLRVDDPVGAISVHLVCGAWGTLAVGLFGGKASAAQIGIQLGGMAAYGAAAFGAAFVIFQVIRRTVGLRVSVEEELEGLDAGEHGMHAYILDEVGPLRNR